MYEILVLEIYNNEFIKYIFNNLNIIIYIKYYTNKRNDKLNID
jgi:hypothetical protein